MSAQRDNLLKRCPCPETKWAKCPHGWHLAKKHDGERYSISLDKYAKRRGLPIPRLRGDADTLADRITREIETGVYQEKPTTTGAAVVAAAAPTGEGALTFDQAWPKYAAGLPEASRGSEQSRCRALANTTIEAGRVGDLQLADITEGDVEECYTAVTEEAAESSKKKLRRHLRGVFAWAVKKQHLPTSPITDETVMRAGEDARRDRRVKPTEEATLLEAAAETRCDAATRLVAILIAALDLGLRLGELLALQWCDILWEEREVYVRAVETGAKKKAKPRRVPMTPRVRESLWTLAALNPTGQPWPDHAYVYGDAIGARVKSIRKAWVTCVLRAHRVLPAWTGTALAPDAREAFAAIRLHFHDLRHECAQRWYAAGYTLGTIARLLGHSDLNTLRVYLGVEEAEALAEAKQRGSAAWVAAEAAEREHPSAAGPRGRKPAAKPATGRLLPHTPKEATRRQVIG